MQLRSIIFATALACVATACQTTPLDNIWPGCQVCPPPQQAQGRIPWEVRIDERVSPAVDCNPVRTQHTLVVTVFDQAGQPLPGQRVEWILSRFPEAVGDIVAVDDQYGVGAIAPIQSAYVGNNGNKVDNQNAISVTNFGCEMIDAGNNFPYMSSGGARLPDITVGPGQSWCTITATREGVTDLVIVVPGIRDGTRHKIFAKKVWADYAVEFPESAVNTLPADSHSFPVKVMTTAGAGLAGQPVEAEILDGPTAEFAGGGTIAELQTGAGGIADFMIRNTSGQSGTNRIRLTAKGSFYGETCPRSRIVTKQWQRVELAVECSYPGGPTAIAGRPFDKVITVTNIGDATAEDVVIEDTPDAGLNIADGSVFPMNMGPLEPGQSATQTVQLSSNAEGSYSNTVRAKDASGTATAQSSCPIEIVKGQLEIAKICDPATANAGSNVRFVVTVSNTGRGPLENVVVTDQYPDGVTPTSQNTATIPLLPAGESREVLFTGRADQTGAFTNFVRAVADGVDEKEASCTLQVVECNLEMELIGQPTIYYGETADFTLKVTNTGDGDAEGCTVRVTYGGCLGGGFQDFNIGPLAPGESWTHDWTGTAKTVGQCNVVADSNCGQRCEIQQTAVVRVTGLPALQVEMTDKALDGTEAGVFRIGETFLYRLRIENDVGTEVTTPLVIVWELPPELEFVSGRCLNGDVAVTGSGTDAETSEFAMSVDADLDFEIQVRVLSAPEGHLVKTTAYVNRASDKAELASEVESTTLKP